ncbi:hypothetical protein AOC36_05505 [Erysipelothrix larvae]|uniref:Calcineurin-like phosphoesterase domain-containing protein n=1 Tax=Erysipelothrix larvae TaxID=1514105 RepID=A0A109UH23_9FIRM|nr:hypothetical protein [Erysipelothrix larvae]AMC93453.1 hypothetical protein AOC36_05505 [Erysipelothrix larvae]
MRKLLNLKKLFIVVCVIAIGVLVYFEITHFAPSRLHATNYSVRDASIPKDFDTVTIAVFSDVYGDIDKLNKAVDMMNMRSPDVVVFLGNLLNTNDEASINEITTALSNINAPLGKYAIFGQYDTFNYESVTKVLDQSDFRLTQNRTVNLHNFTDSNIQFLFLDETNTEQKVNDVLETLDDSSFTMTFMNNPNLVQLISDKNLKVSVAGETLGGKVNLPLIGSLFFKDTYTDSDVTIGNTRLLLSNGIATPEPVVRLFADPNILFITLNASE